MNSIFHPIDMATWERRQFFYYFTKMVPTGYTLNIDIDVTQTRNYLKAKGMKFFPAYLYLTTKLINKQQELRIAYQGEKLGYYEVLHPSYAYFHEDDHTISNIWTEFNESFSQFYESYMTDREKYSEVHGPTAKEGMPPQNSVMVGLIPWVSFKSYNPVPFAGGTSFFPVLEAGKFYEQDGKVMMPFSMMVHHAVADGYHTSLFINRLQEAMNHPEEWA